LKGEFEDYPLWLANYNDVPSPSPDDSGISGSLQKTELFTESTPK
jgi:GH25 family lysozyme M1 (1,4-beta-N-acetylmuramidase)